MVVRGVAHGVTRDDITAPSQLSDLAWIFKRTSMKVILRNLNQWCAINLATRKPQLALPLPPGDWRIWRLAYTWRLAYIGAAKAEARSGSA